VPQLVRTGVSNFFNNFADAWSAVNNFLQGKLAAGLQDVMRVGMNTLFGVFGFIDMAAEAGIDHQYEDFGQTLGRWGVGSGPYIVWPLLGPSTLRDSVALPVDWSAKPSTLLADDASRYAITGISIIDTRAKLLGATKLLDEIALDKYQFVRDGFLQRRRSLVRDGAEEPEEPVDEPAPAGGAAPAAAEGGASAPGK
jgi:phospholipid-binding lipoprotein MlaA